MVGLFAILLSASGFAVLAWLISQRRQMAASFGGASPAVALIGFALVTNLVPLAVPRFGNMIMGAAAISLLAWALMSSSGQSLISPPDPWLRASWLAVGVLLIWCFAVDSLVGFGLYGGSRAMAYAAAAVLFLAIGLMSGRVALDTRALTYVGLFVLSVLTMPTYIAGASVWRPCVIGELEKCSIAGALYKSFYGSENLIAILASFTFVACLCSMRRRQLVLVGSFCLLIIVATGSRTSLLGIGAACAWLGGGILLERRRRYARVPASLALAMSLASVGAAIYLIWTARPSTLSNRGRIWIAVREYISDSAITGVGVSKWYFLRDVGDSPQHYFHSSYVAILFSGGFVALTAWAIWSMALLRAAVRDGRAFSAKAPVVLLLIYSLTEVMWNPISVDGLSWIFVAVMLTGSSVNARQVAPLEIAVATERSPGESKQRRISKVHHFNAQRGRRLTTSKARTIREVS